MTLISTVCLRIKSLLLFLFITMTIIRTTSLMLFRRNVVRSSTSSKTHLLSLFFTENNNHCRPISSARFFIIHQQYKQQATAFSTTNKNRLSELGSTQFYDDFDPFSDEDDEDEVEEEQQQINDEFIGNSTIEQDVSNVEDKQIEEEMMRGPWGAMKEMETNLSSESFINNDKTSFMSSSSGNFFNNNNHHFEEDTVMYQTGNRVPDSAYPISYTSQDKENPLMLEQKATAIEEYIISNYNNGQPINLASSKQLSLLLFGTQQPSSTNKDALEALCTSNNSMLADIARNVLEWKQLKKQIKRITHKKEATFQQTTTSSRDPLLLLDASAFIYRAYYAMPPLHKSDGTPVGAVLGFCNMIYRLFDLVGDPQLRIALIFDSGKPNFRHLLYSDYKANRPSCPVDLVPQFDIIRQAAYVFGLPILIPAAIQTEGSNGTTYEADDVIATIATWAVEAGLNVNLISSDKDLMQLVRDDEHGSIHMVDPMTMLLKTEMDVIDKWGVPPSQLGDLLALTGDSSDNIPGVPGIGPKTAALLLQEFGSLENLLSRVNEISQKVRREKLIQHTDQARLSRKLVELCATVPPECIEYIMPTTNYHNDNINNHPTTSSGGKNGRTMSSNINKSDIVNRLRMEPLNKNRVMNFLTSMGFRDLSRQMQRRFYSNSTDGRALTLPLQTPSTLLEDTSSMGSSSSNRRSLPVVNSSNLLDDIPF